MKQLISALLLLATISLAAQAGRWDIKSGVLLYPDTEKGTVYIANSKLFDTYAILNVNGTLVQKGVVGEGEISIHSLRPGLYFVNLRDKTGEVKTLRFSVLN